MLLNNFKLYLFIVSIVFFYFYLVTNNVFAGTLSCSVTTAASCTGGTNTVIYRMSGSINAHAQLPSQSNVNYNNNVVCCSGVVGLSNACNAPFDIALKLNKTTNAHSQTNGGAYTNNACISVPTGGFVSVGYVTDPTTCVGAGYDTTLGSIRSSTNSHVGNTTAYTTKICATASTPTGLPIDGTLTSSVFDTANSTSIGYNSIMWKGVLGGIGEDEGKVRFQIAAATALSGPWNFYGGDTCGALDFFDTSGPDSPVEIKGANCFSYWNNKRYFRYKVQICSNDCVTAGDNTPTVDDIIVNWAP